MTNEEITELILTESRRLEDLLNDDLLKRFATLHNVPDEHNRFILKQEVVARWAYFLSVKKRYALHITNEEGVNVDKLDTKGLITKRSDYPPLTKERVTEILYMLVMEEKTNFKQLRKFIETTREELLTHVRNGDPVIARPVTFSREREAYKKVPYYLAGMDLWNLLEYEYFVPGTKGYLFKIQGVDWSRAPDSVKKHEAKVTKNKIQYVVLPGEEDKLPPYFIINIDAMIEFCWDARCVELLEPIHSRIMGRRIDDTSILTF